MFSGIAISDDDNDDDTPSVSFVGKPLPLPFCLIMNSDDSEGLLALRQMF